MDLMYTPIGIVSTMMKDIGKTRTARLEAKQAHSRNRSDGLTRSTFYGVDRILYEETALKQMITLRVQSARRASRSKTERH